MLPKQLVRWKQISVDFNFKKIRVGKVISILLFLVEKMC